LIPVRAPNQAPFAGAITPKTPGSFTAKGNIGILAGAALGVGVCLSRRQNTIKGLFGLSGSTKLRPLLIETNAFESAEFDCLSPNAGAEGLRYFGLAENGNEIGGDAAANVVTRTALDEVGTHG
jgi:hypothetical protein